MSREVCGYCFSPTNLCTCYDPVGSLDDVTDAYTDYVGDYAPNKYMSTPKDSHMNKGFKRGMTVEEALNYAARLDAPTTYIPPSVWQEAVKVLAREVHRLNYNNFSEYVRDEEC